MSPWRGLLANNSKSKLKPRTGQGDVRLSRAGKLPQAARGVKEPRPKWIFPAHSGRKSWAAPARGQWMRGRSAAPLT